jgi:hypothetical protein
MAVFLADEPFLFSDSLDFFVTGIFHQLLYIVSNSSKSALLLQGFSEARHGRFVVKDNE